MSKIYIWDCDYNTNPNRAFNYISMKISSYYKQLNFSVTLADKNWLPNGEYDKIIVVRQEWESELPPSIILDSYKTICMGAAMDGFPAYQALSDSQAACRPDYLLFLDKATNLEKYQKIQYIQLTNNFRILPDIQDPENYFTGKKVNLIVDDIWKFSDDNIIILLDKIKKYHNVAFSGKIFISRILKNETIKESFKELHLCPAYRQSFVNDYGNSAEKVKEIIDFLADFKQYRYFKPFKVQSIISNHENPLNARADLFRDLEIMDYSKQKMVKINMTCPKDSKSYFIDYFIQIKKWSNNSRKSSFIDFMCLMGMKKISMSAETILNNRILWYSYNIKMLIYLIKNYYDSIKDYIYREWGDTFKQINFDIDYIKKEG